MKMRKIIFIIVGLLTMTCVYAQYNIECEDTCNHIHGLDMSHYQGNVFWEAVEEVSGNKMHYVYLKATEGGNNIDERYLQNIEMAKKAGLKVGSYHFYRPRIAQEVQLSNFRAQCRPQDQDLIPMIDVESNGGLSISAFCDSLHKFLILVENEYKQKPLVYTGQNFYNKYLVGELDGYKLMIAKYSEPEPQLLDDRDIFAWQYTGKGHIRGVNGFVDKSRLLGRHTMREIRFIHNQ
ncbi:MAG: glycosyl hydrolase family 25 [Prevotella sp.]|nr:glycosyl hydrolase family 25 [Prevotella sp.]